MRAPIYKKSPIGSIEILADILSITPKDLIALSLQADSYYRANKPKVKPNGKVRQTYSVLNPLKEIQGKIKTRIFYEVEFPPYLMGGIRGDKYPRDYISNAAYHSGNKIVIREDITNFFPSISKRYVLRMWKLFFCFPGEVAEILCNLTTYQDVVPQGASTSSYIGNLIFWDKESALEENLHNKGFRYSRFIDDIAISANKRIATDEKTEVTSLVYGMLFSIGVKPNRKKRASQTRGREMTLHKLNVSHNRPTMNKKERHKIRAAVKQCETMAQIDRSSEEYEALYNSVRGRVSNLGRIHRKEAKIYTKRLENVKPVPMK